MPRLHERADLRGIGREYDFVAVPLTRIELETLVSLWSGSDELDHEDLSIWLKAAGALALLDTLDGESGRVS